MKKKVIFIFIFVFHVLPGLAEENSYSTFQDKSGRLIQLPFPDFNILHYSNNLSHNLSPRSALAQYFSRPRFKYLMTYNEEQQYQDKLDKLMKDEDFTNEYKLKTGIKGWASSMNREDAAYAMGQYYFKNWTPFTVGTPRLNLGKSIIETMENLFITRIPLITIPFKTPYKTIYEAEQSCRYYLKKYPKGRYVIPALFTIGQCRIHQKDYLEASISYKYALRFLMENNGFTNSGIEDDLAKKILSYSSRYEEKINIDLTISRAGNHDQLESRFEFNQEDNTISIFILFGKYFNLFSPITNEFK